MSLKRFAIIVVLSLIACNLLNTGTRIPQDAEILVTQAVADLAKRTEMDEGDISVVTVQNKIWRNASLGCPVPGGIYAQVITKGYRIVLKVRDDLYEYHGTGNGPVIYCPQD